MTKTKDEAKPIFIKSVRDKRKSIQIVYTQGADTIDHDFHDNPLPSFYKAIEALVPHVCTLCEFPSKDAAKITATGITCREDGDNTLALITSRKKIKKGGRILNIPTPLLPMYPDEENAGVDHMEKEEAAAIEKVIKETLKYLGGERAQGQIAFVEEDGPKKEAGTEGEQLPFNAEGASAEA
jgi:hypothetical protein